MNAVEKALLNRELSKAAAALSHAFRIARTGGDPDLARAIREQQKALATQITKFNGGPIKLTGAELLNS